MTLRVRTLTLVMVLLLGTVLIIGAIQLLSTRRAVLAQQEQDGLVIARLVARSVSMLNSFNLQLEAVSGFPLGLDAVLIDVLRQQVGVDRLVAALVESGDIEAIFVVDAASGAFTYGLGAGGDTPDLRPADQANLDRVLQDGSDSLTLDGETLKVIVPVRRGAEAAPIDGAVVLFLTTGPMKAAMARQAGQVAVAGAGMLAAGLVASLYLSRRVLGPVGSLTEAVRDVERGEYRGAVLSGVVQRRDELGRLSRFFDRMAREVLARDRRLRLLRKVIPAGVGLSSERDFNRLLETIVTESQSITNADGGTLYILEKGQLKFMIVRNTSMKIAMGGSTGEPVNFPAIPLYDEKTGEANHHNIATYAALCKQVVNIPDAYAAEGFDFSGTRRYDERTGYHSQSFLSIPLESDDREVIGVLQLINAQDPETGKVIPFVVDEVFETLVLLASISLAAYIRQAQLRKEIEKLSIEIDRTKQTRQVAEITDTDYFRSLVKKVRELRRKKKKRTS